jgi:hypothetical protein
MQKYKLGSLSRFRHNVNFTFVRPKTVQMWRQLIEIICRVRSFWLSINLILFSKLMIVTRSLKSYESNENAKNTLQFIRRIFSHVSGLIFDKNSNTETDPHLMAWNNEIDDQLINFSYHGRNRCMPVSFIYSLVIILGLEFDSLLAEIWIENDENFISQIKGWFYPEKWINYAFCKTNYPLFKI